MGRNFLYVSLLAFYFAVAVAESARAGTINTLGSTGTDFASARWLLESGEAQLGLGSSSVVALSPTAGEVESPASPGADFALSSTSIDLNNWLYEPTKNLVATPDKPVGGQIPEPNSLALMATALVGVGIMVRYGPLCQPPQ